ncbi:hypothetical protein LTR64_001532 [Lithohypha guttulata]|uniref:uncharacterized protein n=1 Tax=Lithohypha guttulata TaxID=1690604 RepID=UPI002DE11FD3|nr:hypothetical protein LTR51_003725 [Lithohypha guttulata]
MTGAGWFFLLLFILLLVYGGWIGWRIWQARKRGERLQGWKAYVPFMSSASTGSGTNHPTPRSANPLEWVKDKFDSLRNKRSQTGGYEDTRPNEGAYQGLSSSGGGRARGRGGLEDDPWDSRVGGRDDDPYGPGIGGYNEEAELGLAPTPGPSNVYSGGDYMRQDTGYGGGRGRDAGSHLDPFADSNRAPSLRSVSPRPELGVNTAGHRKMDSEEISTSPISTRKSAFREDMS